uniref:Carboxypeptidase n=1 Tax=Oryza punctata TaxID=4537 RepID=A0A0E0LFY6_ORYPU
MAGCSRQLLLVVVVVAMVMWTGAAARHHHHHHHHKEEKKKSLSYEEVFERQEADRVQRLPGQAAELGFRQFAGYVTVNETHGRALFYWFFEAASDVATKPLVLWLNGGPGCSSVGYGALEELGPLLVNKKESLTINPDSWNKEANLLFVESPAGVGFSYTNTTTDLAHFGDNLTAHDAHAFVVNWLERFPQFKGHELYIAGESYAGHYVPQLATKILHLNKKASKEHRINLKGIMIGNAAIDSSSDDRGLVEYAWDHGVISDEIYAAIKGNCTFPNDGNETDKCDTAWNGFFAAMGDIDIYSLYTPSCTAALNGTNSSRFAKVLRRGLPYKYNTYNPCVDYRVINYLNRGDVQAALHANVSGAIPYRWAPCSDVLTNWTDAPASTLPDIAGLVGAGLRVWVFSGDTDDRVPVTSTRYALRKLKLKTVRPWKEWFTSDQVGGYTVLYEGLTFVTIRGAGHMVPMITPVQARQLFAHFLAGDDMPAKPIVAAAAAPAPA